MNATMNNTTILTAAETEALFEGSKLNNTDTVTTGTLHDIADSIGGAGTSFSKFDANAIRQRVSFIDGVGPDLTQLTSLDAVLELSGLNFNVVKTEARYNLNEGRKGMPPKYVKVPDQYVLLREDTREPLGVVGKNFNVLQNIEAFDFIESLALEGLKYETASTFGRNGAKSFICMSTEGVNILGDDFKPYLVFLNGFDGSQTVQAFFTSVRIFCQNCLNRALKSAQNKVTIRHSNQLKDRLTVAHTILLQNSNYLQALKGESEKLALVSFTQNQFYDWVQKRFPILEENTSRTNNNNERMINEIMSAYYQTDLDNFANSAWRGIQALADVESHMPTFRKAKRPELVNFNNVVDKGMPLLNEFWSVVESIA